jgi:hypothetical protein
MLVSLKYVGVERREEYSFRPSAIVQKSFAIHSVFFFLMELLSQCCHLEDINT